MFNVKFKTSSEQVKVYVLQNHKDFMLYNIDICIDSMNMCCKKSMNYNVFRNLYKNNNEYICVCAPVPYLI